MSDEKVDKTESDDFEDEDDIPFKLTKENFPKVQTTLLYFIQLLATHGYIYLGLIPIPGSEETLFDLEEARRAIDLLAIMVDKAKPDLDDFGCQELDNTVSQLRMNFASKAEKT